MLPNPGIEHLSINSAGHLPVTKQCVRERERKIQNVKIAPLQFFMVSKIIKIRKIHLPTRYELELAWLGRVNGLSCK